MSGQVPLVALQRALAQSITEHRDWVGSGLERAACIGEHQSKWKER